VYYVVAERKPAKYPGRSRLNLTCFYQSLPSILVSSEVLFVDLPIDKHDPISVTLGGAFPPRKGAKEHNCCIFNNGPAALRKQQPVKLLEFCYAGSRRGENVRPIAVKLRLKLQKPPKLKLGCLSHLASVYLINRVEEITLFMQSRRAMLRIEKLPKSWGTVIPIFRTLLYLGL
jgi:hypothetical protein